MRKTRQTRTGLPVVRKGFTLIELLACQPKPERRRQTQAAFTLIELLVVITIIALLVGILAPAITRAIAMGYKAKSVAGMQELNSGAMGYYKDINCYPGQNYRKADGSFKTSVTGSQVLAACIFGGLAFNATGDLIGIPSDGYISWKLDKTKEEIINKETGLCRVYYLSDRFPDEKAFMYFPSNPGNDGSSVATAFRWADNDDYATGDDGKGKFDGTNAGDPNWNAKMNVAQKYDTYLIIGPGIDRYYYTDSDSEDAYSDNVTNF